MKARLAGRRVLVTGASRGIGAACARALAAAGATVLAASRGREALDAIVASLPGCGHQAIRLDVARPDDWDAAMEIVDAGSGLHGLVHAAGELGPIGPVDAIDPAAFADAVAVNLGGTFLALHHVVPRLAATGDGAAVTFSGGGATGPLPGYDAYAASKAGVVRLTENVAAQAAERGVRINAVAPGFVATSIHDATLAAGPESAGADYYERTRLELRSGGVPAELVADLVCFLLGPGARPISGRLISAQWDPWQDDSFAARLVANPALATLRRIDGQAFTSVP